MYWIYSFGAKQWTPEDLPYMMSKAFEAFYKDDSRHGPFVLNNLQRSDDSLKITLQFKSEWEGIEAIYSFSYSDPQLIIVFFSVEKNRQKTPSVNLSYPRTYINKIPYELVTKTFELIDGIDNDKGGSRDPVTSPKSPSYVTGAAEDDLGMDEVARWIQNYRKEFFEKRFRRQYNQDPGGMVHEHLGVWQYPFSKVKKSNDGYYIDWFEDPGPIRYLEKVSPGDRVGDFSLNMTPYWEVNYVDENTGHIWLTPIEPNPYITGRGAGGAEWTEHDTEVTSGDYERNRIDGILRAIQEKEVSSPRDVAYILKGTVPVHIGPNLSQGGWYSPTDIHSNRGGREGMNSEQIQATDAKSLKQIGFQIPQLALEGKMDMEVWSRIVDGSSIDPRDGDPKFEQMKLPEEDWNNSQIVAKFILENPVPEVKMRNWNALKQIFNPFPIRKRKLDPGETYDTYYEQRDKLIEEWRSGKYIKKDMLPFIHYISIKIFELKHPKAKYDPYWLLKEGVINFAQEQNWEDVLELYSSSTDFNIRESLITVLDRAKNKRLLLKMFQTEDHSKIINDILSALQDVANDKSGQEFRYWGDDLRHLILANLNRLQAIINRDIGSPYSWAAKQLQQHVDWAKRSANNKWFAKIACKEYLLRVSALPDDPKRREFTKWKLAPKLKSLLIGCAGSATDICIYKVIKSTELPNIVDHELSNIDDWLSGSLDENPIPQLPGEEHISPMINNINRMKDIIERSQAAGDESLINDRPQGDMSNRGTKFDPGRHVPVETIDVFASDTPNAFIGAYKIGDKKFVPIGITATSFYKYVDGIGGIRVVDRMRLLFGDIPRALAAKYPKLIGGDLKRLVPEYQTYAIGEYNVVVIREKLLLGKESWLWYVPELKVSSEEFRRPGEFLRFESQQAAIDAAEKFINQFAPAS